MYCQQCSDIHLAFKPLLEHNLIDLDPPGFRSIGEVYAELTADFIEHLEVTENTIFYRPQIVFTGEPSAADDDTESDGQVNRRRTGFDPSELRSSRFLGFSVRRPDDLKDIHVKGVLMMAGKYIIIDYENHKLKLFDGEGKFLSFAKTKENTWGITKISEDRFATCGVGHKIVTWVLYEKVIYDNYTTYPVDHYAESIHFNGTYYSVLHRDCNAVTVLDNRGARVNKIVIKKAFDKRIDFGLDIHSDNKTHHIYVPCDTPTGVLCVSIEGDALRFTDLPVFPRGITEAHGQLCIVLYKEATVILLSKDGEKKYDLIEKKNFKGKPMFINFFGDKIAVIYNHKDYGFDIVSVFSVFPVTRLQ